MTQSTNVSEGARLRILAMHRAELWIACLEISVADDRRGAIERAIAKAHRISLFECAACVADMERVTNADNESSLQRIYDTNPGERTCLSKIR